MAHAAAASAAASVFFMVVPLFLLRMGNPSRQYCAPLARSGNWLYSACYRRCSACRLSGAGVGCADSFILLSFYPGETVNGRVARSRARHGNLQLRVHLSVHRLEPHRAADRGRLQGGHRDAHRQGRKGRRQARRPVLRPAAACAESHGRGQHHRRADRGRARLRQAGGGDRRDRHRRGRRPEGRAGAAGRKRRRRREASDPLRDRRHEDLGEGGRSDRPVAGRRARTRAPGRADLPRQYLPPGEQQDRARQGEAQQVQRIRHPLGRLERHAQRPLRALRVVGIAAGLAAIAGLAWFYLWGMASMPGGMETGIAMTLAMWTVMMAAMMLPSASPAILLYAAMVRKNAERGVALAAVWLFVAGYLLAWAGFAVLAALLQAALEGSGLLAPMMLSASPAILLYAAMVRKNAERGVALAAVWLFVAGYLLAWAGFAVLAALLQAALEGT